MVEPSPTMAPRRYRVIDGPHRGRIVSHDEVRDRDCLRCAGLDPECRTCLGVGYVLGWNDENDHPTGRLEPIADLNR